MSKGVLTPTFLIFRQHASKPWKTVQVQWEIVLNLRAIEQINLRFSEGGKFFTAKPPHLLVFRSTRRRISNAQRLADLEDFINTRYANFQTNMREKCWKSFFENSIFNPNSRKTCWKRGKTKSIGWADYWTIVTINKWWIIHKPLYQYIFHATRILIG